MNQLGIRCKLPMVYLVLLLVGALSCLSKAYAEQKVVGIFQFTADSMDVVGIENDVTYVVRNELRKSENLSLLNQRDMEVTLMRNEVIQNFDVDDAVRAGHILNVDYIIIGKVSRSSGGIVSDISLISVVAKQAINSWSFNFSNRQNVLNNADTIGKTIIDGINGDLDIAYSQEKAIAVNWLAALNVEVSGGFITVDWQLVDSSIDILGFNLYKSSSAQGPFSYVSSVLEFSYQEAIDEKAGEVFYQLSLINGEGEEIRSENIAKVTVQAVQKSSIAAPAVVKTTAFVSGFEILFVPSATNSRANITEYQLLRRSQALPWQVTASVKVNGLDKNKKGSKSVAANIQNYTLSDNTTEINVDYDYAIRAVNNLGELGRISVVYSYQAVNSPRLLDTGISAGRSTLLKWQPVSIGSGYVLYRRMQEATEWHKLITISDITNNVYEDTDIQQDGQVFEYSMSVFDPFSETEKSVPVTLKSKPPLIAPKSFEALSGLPRRVKLTWRSHEDYGLKGYAIFRAPFTEDTSIKLLKIDEILDPSADSYIDKTADADGTAYYYAVAGINEFDSAGELSPVVRATTKLPPQGPEFLNTEVLETMISLTWGQEDLSAVDGYVIQRRWQQQKWHDIATVLRNVFSFNDTELLPEANVQYRIQAIDSDGLLSQSVMSVEQQTLNKLAFIKQRDGLLREVNLHWPAMALIEKIEVLRRTNKQRWRVLNTLGEGVSSYSDTVDLLDDIEYEYQLKIYLGGILITSSDVLAMKTKGIASPNAMTVSLDKPRKIIVNWQLNLDKSIKSVILYRASAADNYTQYSLIAEIADKTVSEFIDTTNSGSIKHGVTYRYKLASKNVFDAIGPQSLSASGNSKNLPSSPSHLKATANEITITLNWGTGNERDLDRVVIFRKWQHQLNWEQMSDMPAEITSYEDDELLPYANAAYKLLFTDLDGLSSEESLVINQTSPIEVDLVAQTQGLLRATALQWPSNNLVDSYGVIRSIDKVNWSTVGTTASSRFSDTKGLADQSQYFYRVLPIQAASELGQSNIVSVATKDLPPPPANITSTGGFVRQIVLNWEQADDEDVGGYIVNRKQPDGSLDRLAKLNRTSITYIDKGGLFSKLEHGTQYDYVLTSYNIHGVQGQASNIISATTKAVPKQVTGLSVKSMDGQVILDWLKNSETDLKNYQVFRGKSCGRTQKKGNVSSDLISFTDTKVEAGKQYCYQVLAVDNDSLQGIKSTGAVISLPEIVTP